MLRYLTAGESHGPALVAILEGMPSNVPLVAAEVNRDLARRQKGYGRGGRMKIESDQVEILGGVRHGYTLGSPIALLIRNRDWENWKGTMEVGPPPAEARLKPPVERPRPGHADFGGALKYDHHDLRGVLERASARETVARVAVGAVGKKLLGEFGIRIVSHVLEIGGVRTSVEGVPIEEIAERAEASETRCADPAGTRAMMARIDEARSRGTSVGGVFEVIALDLPIGLGSHVHWDRKLDGRLAQGLMSVQAIKGVEIGLGFEAARRFGTEAHDEIFFEGSAFVRRTNRAGGLEGGITDGQPLVIRAAMKPLSTQYTPLASVNMETKEPSLATIERTDICAVPAAAVIGEAVVAFTLADAFLEKFGGDSLAEVRRNFNAYLEYLKGR